MDLFGKFSRYILYFIYKPIKYSMSDRIVYRQEVPALKEIWTGPLPRKELAAAYASADVVLASTIESQREMGMINNRIFEALSCGAVVISEPSPEIKSYAH